MVSASSAGGAPTNGRSNDIAKRKLNPELIDDENPEWSAAEVARARPGIEVLSPSLLENIRRVRGKQKTPTKESITIRLSPDVVKRFRDSGTGWQGRMDDALRDWLKRHSPMT